MSREPLKKINIALILCTMAFLVCYDTFGGLWLKGVTSAWFVLLGGVNLWAARKLQWKQLRFYVLVEAGLLCGMCADVLLGVDFFVGIGVFALGHVLYLIAFYSLEKVCFRDLWIIGPLTAISVFVVIGTPWICVTDPILRKLLLGYAVIIAAMLGKAISNLISSPSPYRWLLALGGLLFWFSDLMLAIDIFGQPSRLTWILCSYTYWPAQTIIAHSLFHARPVRT